MQTGKHIETRFYERKKRRTVIAWVFCIVSIIYLTWRLTIFNFDALLLSISFYTAECIGFLLALGAIFSSREHVYHTSKPILQPHSVDVFITVYKEPYDVIRRTIKAAVAIDYPHTTVVLDDGRRPEIKQLAESLGCRYLSREMNTNAKAGNLNFGFQNTTGEFVMVFDADHIPQPNAIDALVGFFKDPDIAFAQTPQNFYNTDCLQFINAPNGALWHDQSYYYHIISPNAACFNGATCMGTGVMYRRSAIEAIGGIPENTVTEDLHTSLKLHKKGFKSIYHNEQIAYGIGESTLSDYYKVRLRWGHGNIHALRHENVLFCKGLTLRQRLSYLIIGLNYLEGWQYLILYLIPIISLFTGIPPFEITLFNIFLMILYPIVVYLLVQELACGFGRFWVNELFSMIRFPIAILATFAVFRNKMAWRHSKKRHTKKIEWPMMAPQLSVVVLSLAAIGYAIFINWTTLSIGPVTQILMDPSKFANWDLHTPFETGFNSDLLLIAGFWALLNVARGVLFLVKICKNTYNLYEDYHFRIPIIAEINVDEADTDLYTTQAVSLSHVTLAKPLNIKSKSDQFTGRLYLPNFFLETIFKPEKPKRHTHKTGNCQKDFSIHFKHKEDLQKLEDCLYSIAWHRNLFHKDAEFITPLTFLARIISFGFWNPKDISPIWHPILQPDQNGNKELAYKNIQKNAGKDDLIIFKDRNNSITSVFQKETA